ncbi:Hsp20/alpha crystallin family protein [Candidatus Wolfebacteria bacterium]|nr:Hsp20/alpha crystallin family protein [Candidatus Wolfebacteria bacterium]
MNEDTKKFFEKLAGVADETEDFEPKMVKADKIDIEEKEGKKAVEEMLFDEGEGQLTLDVYQTANDIVIESPIAGILVDDLDVEISPESVTIRGKREKKEKIEKKDYLYQELYWGRFSRSVILPQEINPDHAKADFKNGVLKIVLPKINKQKSKKMKIRFE